MEVGSGGYVQINTLCNGKDLLGVLKSDTQNKECSDDRCDACKDDSARVLASLGSDNG